jgi:hypothetical protein
MQPLVVFIFKFCLVWLKRDNLYLLTFLKTLTNWADFTVGSWCSHAQSSKHALRNQALAGRKRAVRQ